MKKNLLVTLADKNYINQAKQLFSSVYFNTGWEGDYMLLAYKIPEKELKWFRDKGILIKKCKPFAKPKTMVLPQIVFSKFYLFTHFFKRWKNIVFLEADIIVRASINELSEVDGFAAVPDDCGTLTLLDQFQNKYKQNIINKYKKYDFKTTSFNSGLIVFNTKIITKGTFKELLELSNKFEYMGKFGEQPILNLYFYKKWKKLPYVYNLLPKAFTDLLKIRIDSILLHFYGDNDPWHKENLYYDEWKSNLKKADLIDFKKSNKPKKWSKLKIISYSQTYKILFLLNMYFGKVGLFLKMKYPRLYELIKK